MLKIIFWKNKLALKVLSLAFCLATGFFWYAQSSSGAKREFAAAQDFPRGAVVYAQFRDLPALLKLWDESDLKQKYLESENFRQFQKQHLALKLVSRWQEFNDALGFEMDAATVIGAAENQAAIAVYDIGKMEMIFVAPVTAEKFAATMFFQNQSEFEVTELADNTVYYSRRVEADDGRQAQKILFAHSGERFILATSENLLLRTLANINRKSAKASLADEPVFANLAKRLTPHLATVWVNQEKLNEDYYFRRYWLPQNHSELKAIRSGMFDFEMQDKQIIERREFLLKENNQTPSAKITAKEAASLRAFVPVDAPYFRLQTLADNSPLAYNLLRETVVEEVPDKYRRQPRGKRWTAHDSFDNSESNGDDYAHLNWRFSKIIDEDDQSSEIIDYRNEATRQTAENLQQVLANAEISSAAAISNPYALDAPLFVFFEKAVVFKADSLPNLNRREFENSLATLVMQNLTVANESADFAWETQSADKNQWRVLKLKMLRREICYAVRGDALIVANSARFLDALLNNKDTRTKFSASFNQLSVVRLDRRANAFDAPMNALLDYENKQRKSKDKITADEDFFTGNIGSLLTAINRAKQIEIKRNDEAEFMTEEITMSYE